MGYLTFFFASNLSLNTSAFLWDDFLTSRQESIENKGFFKFKVRVRLKKELFEKHSTRTNISACKIKKKSLFLATYLFWLGWLDSNQRMTVSKTVALPLGDSPIINWIKTTLSGALGEIRTHDPCLRRAILYPAELQAQQHRFFIIIHKQKRKSSLF